MITESEKGPEEGREDLVPLLEALLFANGEPVAVERLAEAIDASSEEIERGLAALAEKLAGDGHGIELVAVADKYQLRTKARFGSYLQALAAGKPRKLSPAALETLSIIAYRQPIVRSDVEKIRGVDATPTIKTLLERRLIKIVGHQPTVGQPALYGTTEEFLKLFGLKSLAELPTLRDLNELDSDPGETPEDDEPAGEESASAGPAPDETGGSGECAGENSEDFEAPPACPEDN